MTDGLVKLYELPNRQHQQDQLQSAGYQVRRAMSYEKAALCRWVQGQFGENWLSECDMAFSQLPVTCFIATHRQQVVGFACYDVTLKNFFGPMGVSSQHQSRGIGTVLLVRSLQAMYAMGYGYAIVGGMGRKAVEFYQKAVGLELINDSVPGIYKDKLQPGCAPIDIYGGE